MDKAGTDNRANQLNSNNALTGPVKGSTQMSQAATDNRADQKNPNNAATGPVKGAGK